MVLRVNSIIQTYSVPEMRTYASGKQSIFVNGFIRQMKEEKPLWVTIVLCPERFGKLVPNLRPKTRLWVSGIMTIESYVTRDYSSAGVKLKLHAEGVEVVSWGQNKDREEPGPEPEPEPEQPPDEESDPGLFPF